MQIGVIDYGVGNIANAIRCLEHIATTERIVRVYTDRELKQCDKIILPGVGAFGSAIEHLKARGLNDALCEYAKSGRYLLGICLGMQLLLDKSYEFGEHKGLGLISGEVVSFGSKKSIDWYMKTKIDSKKHIDFKYSKITHKDNILDKIQTDNKSNMQLKIPHIGWNKNFIKKPHDLCLHIQKSCYLYFVHSYHVCCDNEFIIATCDYGISFPSIIGHDNILGIQPHPERSHIAGFNLMRQFLKLT